MGALGITASSLKRSSSVTSLALPQQKYFHFAVVEYVMFRFYGSLRLTMVLSSKTYR